MSIILFPFRMIWSLISVIFNLTGKLIGVALGFIMAIVGLVLTVTVVGAVVGVPLLIFGLLFILRSLF